MGNNKTKKLKILFLINSLKIGGAEIVFIKLSEYLKNQGYDVFLGTTDSVILNKKKDLFSELQFPIQNLLDFKGFWKLIRFVKENEIDVVCSTLDRANIVSRILKLFIPSLKVVIRESGTADRKSIKLKIFDIVLNLFCDKIIAVSDEVKETILEYQSFYRKKVEVINNGAEIILTEKEILDHINNKSNNDITILSVGNMKSDNKNQEGIINALREIIKLNPSINIKLKLIGDGSVRSKLEALVKSYNLERNVVFIGQVPHAKMFEFYLSADLFIINSIKEGFSNSLLEAMSFGLPVISTKTGGAQEIVKEGINGFLVGSGDRIGLEKKIFNLIINNQLRKEMGIEAYKMVSKNFSLKEQFNKYIDIFNGK